MVYPDSYLFWTFWIPGGLSWLGLFELSMQVVALFKLFSVLFKLCISVN